MDYQHTGRDRSLGSTELAVTGLVREGTDRVAAPWLSTGKHEANDTLKSDGKKTVKGTIYYEAEFHPCANLGGVSFDPPPTPVEIAKDDVASDTASTIGGEEDLQEIASPAVQTQTATSPVAAPAGTEKEAAQHVTIPRADLLKARELYS